MKVRVTVPKIVNIVTALKTNMDFDNFTTLSDTAMIAVQSTTTINISAETNHNGRLVSAKRADESAAKFGYPIFDTIQRNHVKSGANCCYPVQCRIRRNIVSVAAGAWRLSLRKTRGNLQGHNHVDLNAWSVIKVRRSFSTGEKSASR